MPKLVIAGAVLAALLALPAAAHQEPEPQQPPPPPPEESESAPPQKPDSEPPPPSAPESEPAAPPAQSDPVPPQEPGTEPAPPPAIAPLPAPPTIPEPPYKPRFPGDPAQSRAEANALGYMRTVVNAQRLHQKKHGRYATNLQDLVGHGSFTRRMVSNDRDQYTVAFRATPKTFQLTLTPKEFTPERRAFFVDESGVIRVELDKEASIESERL